MKRVVGFAAVVLGVLALGAGSVAARSKQATVRVYPSGTTFTATGSAPSGASTSVSLAMPIGGIDDATFLVQGAHGVAIEGSGIQSPLQLKFMFAHYVSVDRKPVPDALLPWDGSLRPTEHPNQPIWMQVVVPQGTAPGTYTGSVAVLADGAATTIPISVTVYDVTLPAEGQVPGSLLTAFSFSPQSYGAEVNKLYGITAQTSVPELFRFFGSYRLSPNNWGYGNPSSRHGYTHSKKWWLDKASQMEAAVGDPRQFGSMWIPVSNNRWSKSTYVGGVSPFKPKTWCSYLKAVHGFWQQHDWLQGTYPYVYGLDEPGAASFKIVRQQAKMTHKCFPGGHDIVTGNPSGKNKYLWNGGNDDVDAWVVLASRYYGKFTVPKQQRKHISHATAALKFIDKVRKHHKQIWTYTYNAGSHSTPGFTATEPLSDPRMFVDWAAYEGITGLLYGQGTTTYGKTNPLNSNDREGGAYVLIYPGKDAPVPSARLEVLREGIEDWEILNIVREKHGARAVRQTLSRLFSTTAKGMVELGCTVGCQLTTTTRYSWPTYSRDATTAGKIADMRLAALRAAS